MKQTKSKATVFLGFVGVLALSLIIGAQFREPSVEELVVERLFETAFAAPSRGTEWKEGMTRLISLGPVAVEPLVRHINGQSNSAVGEKYGVLWPKLPRFLRDALPRPVDYDARRQAALMVIADHGPFAARRAVDFICSCLADSHPTTVRMTGAALDWVLSDSAIALKCYRSVLKVGNAQAAFASGVSTETWALVPELASDMVPFLNQRSKSHLASIALRSMGTHAAFAVPELISLLNDRSGETDAGQVVHNRAMAARALGETGVISEDVMVALANAWNDPESWVCKNAAESTARLGPAFGGRLPLLVAGLSETNGLALRYKIKAIGELGPEAKSALPELRRLSDENELKGQVIARRIVGETVNDLSLGARMAISKITGTCDATLINDLIDSWGHLWDAVTFMTNAVEHADLVVRACETVLLEEPERNAHLNAELVILSHRSDHIRALASLKHVIRSGGIDERINAARWLLATSGWVSEMGDVIEAALGASESHHGQTALHLAESLTKRERDVGDLIEDACWHADQHVRRRAGRLLRRYHPERLPAIE